MWWCEGEYILSMLFLWDDGGEGGVGEGANHEHNGTNTYP